MRDNRLLGSICIAGRSVIVRMDDQGHGLETIRISNDLDRLTEVMSRAGVHPEVVLEAT